MQRAWLGAFRGFLLCGVGILGLHLAMRFGAPFIGVGGEHARWVAEDTARYLAMLCTVYWIGAAFGGAPPTRAVCLIATLGVFGTISTLVVVANTYFGWADIYCDVLPFPHQGFQLMKIGECPSSQTFFTVMAGAGLFLILASLVVRLALRAKVRTAS